MRYTTTTLFRMDRFLIGEKEVVHIFRRQQQRIRIHGESIRDKYRLVPIGNEAGVRTRARNSDRLTASITFAVIVGGHPAPCDHRDLTFSRNFLGHGGTAAECRHITECTVGDAIWRKLGDQLVDVAHDSLSRSAMTASS